MNHCIQGGVGDGINDAILLGDHPLLSFFIVGFVVILLLIVELTLNVVLTLIVDRRLLFIFVSRQGDSIVDHGLHDVVVHPGFKSQTHG